MNFDLYKQSKETAQCVREKFVELFVDTSRRFYQEHICESLLEAIKAYEIGGHAYSFLYCCLKKGTYYYSTPEKAIAHLKTFGEKSVYIMFDLHPLKVGYNEVFPSDTVLLMTAKEAADIVEHDVIKITDIRNEYWGEDVYIIDTDFKWHIDFSHDDFDDGTRYCYTSIKSLEDEEIRIRMGE